MEQRSPADRPTRPSPAQPSGPASPPLPVSIGLVALVAAVLVVIVAGYVVLAALGRDTLPYITFVSGPAVTGLVGLLLARRAASISSDLRTVKDNTNGLLSAQFDYATDDRRAIAAVAEATAQRNADHSPPAGTQ